VDSVRFYPVEGQHGVDPYQMDITLIIWTFKYDGHVKQTYVQTTMPSTSQLSLEQFEAKRSEMAKEFGFSCTRSNPTSRAL
jgi:hypothetical protein